MRKGNVAAAEVLLQAGADVHAATRSGDTALHWAAYTGSAEIAQLVLVRRARAMQLRRTTCSRRRTDT